MLEIRRLIRTTNLDILIVADKSDLNVYKTANVDGKEVGCCGSAGQAKSSCKGGNDAVEMGGELEDIDLNEWAGKILPFYQICCAKPSLCFCRLIQNICRQIRELRTAPRTNGKILAR